MVTIGTVIVLVSLLSMITGILGTKGYSAVTLTMGYCGIVLLGIGASNILNKKYVFFVTIFLSSTALYGLALVRYEITGSKESTNIAIWPGTILLAIGIILFTYIILKLNSSLSNRRKIYQTFSLIMFNLGALGIVAKHLIAPGLHCYACPWATAGCPIGLLQNWVIMGEIPYYLLGYFLTLFAIVGRAFCGWACPFGFLHDVVDKITNVKYSRTNLSHDLYRIKCILLRKKISGMPKKSARPRLDHLGALTYLTRTIVFIALILFAWEFVDTMFCKLCPAGLLEAALPYRLSHNVFSDTLFVMRVVIFTSLLLIAIVVSRFWCRFFCPLGHLAGHFNRFSLLRLKLDESRCISCGLCKKACPMELSPELFLKKQQEKRSIPNIIFDTINKEQTNCTLCGECVEACKRVSGALTISFDYKPQFSVPRPQFKLPKIKIKREREPRIQESTNKFTTTVTRPAPKPPIPKVDAPRVHIWKRPVYIDVFYKSHTELSNPIMRLEGSSDYIVHKHNIYYDEKSADYYKAVYSGFVETPIIITNGQLYTGPVNNVNAFLQFVRRVEETYNDIYISCNAQRCTNICKQKTCSNIIGTLDIKSNEKYPLSSFNAKSPGAILASCHYDGLFALYGKGAHVPLIRAHHGSMVQTPKRGISDKNIQELRRLPVVTIEMFLKKDSDISNDIINNVLRASFYSGGKLRYFITEWEGKMPEIYVNSKKIPSYLHPSTFATLLFIIKQYAK